MNFEFSEDQKMLREQAQSFLADKCDSKAVRKILDGDEPYDKNLWKGCAEMGFMGTAIPEEYGGYGIGYLELCVIAEEMGRAVAPIPFSSSIYLFAEGLLLAGGEDVKKAILPGIASGEKIGTLAVSEGSGSATPKNIQLSASGNKLNGTKIPVPDGDIADYCLVIARTGRGNDASGLSLFCVDLNGKGVTRESVNTIDPTRSHAKITFKDADATPIGETGQGWDLLTKLYDRAAVLFAFEQIGGAQAALDMAKNYAMERYAFGRPIGSFQAIKHKLADMYVHTELARSNGYYGAWALSTNAAELPIAAATARVSASEAYHFNSKENIQTHGGMGFTWEFDCHLYYRRSKVLSLALGSQQRWKDILVDRLEKQNVA